LRTLKIFVILELPEAGVGSLSEFSAALWLNLHPRSKKDHKAAGWSWTHLRSHLKN
jgi:hypothetical protein